MAMRLCELENKEVINACDCKKLGCIVDLVIDECNGCIEALVIPKAGKLCGFFCDGSEYIIPFKCIRKIGEATLRRILSWWRYMRCKRLVKFLLVFLKESCYNRKHA